MSQGQRVTFLTPPGPVAVGLGREGWNIFEPGVPCVTSLLSPSCHHSLGPSLHLPSTQADLALFLPSPTGRLEEYLGSMAKIQKAVEYFQDNSPDSPELNKVVRDQQGNMRAMGIPVTALVS